MPRKPSVRRRMATMARWPVGVTFTAMRYLWRTTPIHRTEEEGNLAEDMPPPVPDGVSLEEWQRLEDGAGPLFHRRYRTRIRESPMTPEELMDAFSSAPDWAAPTEFASFAKVKGEEDVMRVGDEWMVHMAAPWDGPVRVVDKTPTSFRLITLDDHLEAGQIEFRVRQEEDLLIFEIESWARSATRLVHLLYDKLRASKETQLHMWVSTLEGAARLAKGKRTLGVDIHTRRVEYADVAA